MKKKTVAVVLSLSMCMSTALPAGAAAFDSSSMDALFTSGEADDSQQASEELPVLPEQPDEESPEELPETPDDEMPETPEAPDEETPETPDGEETPESPEEELPEDLFTEESETTEDAFSAGTEEGTLISAEGAILVTAEDWEKTEEGFKLHKAGELPESEYEYYTEEDGILLLSTEYKDVVRTGYYLFDTEGYLVTGKKAAAADTYGLDTDAEFYFTDMAHAVVYSECSGEEAAPYSSTLGRQVINDWVWTNGAFSFYDENGQNISIPKLIEIYKQAGNYMGYFAIKGEYYCLDSKGVPRTGNVTINSAKYYFETAQESGDDIPGRMFHEGWRVAKGSKGDRWMYYNQGATVPKDIGKLLERGCIATRLDTEKMGNDTYLIDKYGYILKSTMRKAANDAYYCTDKNGKVYKDKLVKYKNVRYYFTANGQRATWKNMWHRCPGASNRYYYFGSTPGKVVEKYGWQKITNTSGSYLGWYYFNTAGNHYTDKMTSTGYYFTKTGKLASGITDVNGKKILCEVSDANTHKGKIYKNTLVYYKNKWYYAGADGALWKDGWKKVGSNWYYFNNYRAVTKKFMKKDGKNGYLDSSGKYTTGWVIVSNAQNKIRYIDPDGNGYLKNGTKWVDGLLYHFDSNGYRINDLTNIYKGPYYVTVDRKNGVMTIYNSDKTVPVKSIRVSVGLSYTPTPTGTYRLSRSLRWQPLMGPSWGQYGTHVDGAGQGGIFVHSVSGGHMNSYSLPVGEYNKLGNPASHGCIRACVADAKWVFDNCNGATIKIFDGVYNANEALKGPLGRRPLVRATGSFDPTDPAV